MAYLNENYLKLQAGYLFPEIARRVREFSEGNPAAAKRLIRCGIGDVTEPLPAAAVDAMHRAVEELGHREFSLVYKSFELGESNDLIQAVARLLHAQPEEHRIEKGVVSAANLAVKAGA